jgi:hypothetical protein
VGRELKELLNSLIGAHVIGIDVIGNFIIYIYNANYYIVPSLIHVLINILNRLYRRVNLNVNI